MKGRVAQDAISFLGIGLAMFVLYLVARNLQDVEAIIAKAGLAGPFVAIVLYGLFAPTPVSTDPITIVCGAMYGPVYGTFIAWMGNNVAAFVEYYIGRRIGLTANFDKERKKLPLGLDKLPINSIPVLTLGRMIPFYGSKIISILAGIYKVPVQRYLWTSALVNFTGALMLSYGGFKVLDILKGLIK